MFKDPLHWFPSVLFSNIFALFVLGAFFVDYAVTKLINRAGTRTPAHSEDRGSFQVIQLAGGLSILIALALRYMNLGITQARVQYLGLVLIALGLAIREWAVIKLGRFFSRVVEIEAGHQLIEDGPYRVVRHPAYTGMLLIDVGIALALGTWLGALVTLVLVSGAILYRIKVEEQVLIQAFGDEYRAYMRHTGRLFPGL